MMQFNGQITIISLLTNQVLLKENLVCKRTYQDLISQICPFTNARRIITSTLTQLNTIDGFSNFSPNFNALTLNSCLASGFNSIDAGSYTDVTSFTFIEKVGSASRKVRYWGRFPFTGSIRSFSTIGICTQATGSTNLAGVNLPMYAYTTLTEPIAQLPNEIIDIKYEISITWDVSFVEPYPGFKDQIEYFAFGQLASTYWDNGVLCRTPILNLSAVNKINPIPETNKLSITLTPNSTLLKNKITGNINSSTTITKTNDMCTGTILGYNPVTKQGLSFTRYSNSRKPFNNIYSHSSASVRLLYDATNLGTSTFRPILELVNPLAETDDSQLPALIFIFITGTDQYKFYKLPYFGTHNYTNSPLVSWMAPTGFAALSNLTNPQAIDFDPYVVTRLSERKVIVRAQNSIYIIDVLNQVVDSTYTLSESIGIRIVGISAVSNYIYISTLLGLFEINVNTSTITKLNSLTCYGISVTPDQSKVVVWINDGSGYVVFSPGSYSLTTRYNGFTGAPAISFKFFDSLKGISVHSVAVDQHSANLTKTLADPNTYTVYYEDLIAGTRTLPGLGSRTQQCTVPGKGANQWSSQLVTFNLAQTIIYAMVYANGASTADTWQEIIALRSSDSATSFLTEFNQVQSLSETLTVGNPSIAPLTDQKLVINVPKTVSLLTSNEQIGSSGQVSWTLLKLNADGISQTRKIGHINSAPLPSIDQQIVTICSLARDLMIGVTDKNLGFVSNISTMDFKDRTSAERFGWNGSSWVLGNSGSKARHSAAEPLIDGITIRWEDLNPGGSVGLVNNEYYTQTIFNGFIIDGFQPALPVDYSIYLRPVVQWNFANAWTIPSVSLSLTTLITDPDFYLIDTTDLTLHVVYIGNSAFPAIVKNQATAPNIGEIALQSNGMLYFNVGDIGKVVTGFITYLKKVHTSEV